MKNGHKPALALAMLGLGGIVHAACASWSEGGSYMAGQVVQHRSQAYTALVSHTAYIGAGWSPEAGSSLWRVGGSCEGSPAATPQPTAVATPRPSTPTSAPTPAAGSCSDPAWSSASTYTGGQRVRHLGQRYEARWWTQNEDPTKSGAWGVWKLLGPCETTTPTPTVTPSPTPTPQVTPAGVLAQVNHGGRLQPDSREQVSFSWPGVYFEGRFSGTGVGLVLDDSVGHYNVEIDSKPWGKIAQPGRTTYWIDQLPAGEHTVRLSKRTESMWSAARFGGLVAASGGQILPPAAPPLRQIEFIGDSYTAGLGAESGKRECTDAELTASTNADATFGVRTARHYGAAYQLNGYSGLGLVRNYGGNLATVNYRSYYDRAIVADAASVWQNPGNWRPQVVVVGLGINDFSTPVAAGEAYTAETLRSAYKSAYRDFIAKLRQQYGNPYVVVSATALWPDNTFREVAQEIVNEAKAAGDSRIAYFYYDGLDSLGCQWHPSVKDHQLIADKLIGLLDGLQVWQ
ncbi:carbohydrate-binding protein [Chitinolyticbacter meiyuanensis]|uniref:carbohydrate-binding protein n=1 Tax=Chitinolyticbacter meiyuanensis TaxID=682798 RepID=UPI0011E5F9CB|nr:carbohydrate-binding protein [Chitinolyticbacter meiyuanensis]